MDGRGSKGGRAAWCKILKKTVLKLNISNSGHNRCQLEVEESAGALSVCGEMIDTRR